MHSYCRCLARSGVGEHSHPRGRWCSSVVRREWCNIRRTPQRTLRRAVRDYQPNSAPSSAFPPSIHPSAFTPHPSPLTPHPSEFTSHPHCPSTLIAHVLVPVLVFVLPASTLTPPQSRHASIQPSNSRWSTRTLPLHIPVKPQLSVPPVFGRRMRFQHRIWTLLLHGDAGAPRPSVATQRGHPA